MKVICGKSMFLCSILTLLLVSGCSFQQEAVTTAEMANPASEYCARKGGTLEIVSAKSGEKGMCHLPDGTVIEEWALFRRENVG